MKVNLDDMAYDIHHTAEVKGFWDVADGIINFYVISTKLALIHSEVTELLECFRKGKTPVEMEGEFADIIIRVLDLYAATADTYNMNSINEAVKNKMEENTDRPYLHGHKFG